MKRGASGHSLVVAIDKPRGMSSHDVVNACRRVYGERRVGHLGTLDPLASGVLELCVGPATRLDAFISQDDKEYEAWILVGKATETDDSEGEVIATSPLRDELFDESYAKRVLEAFLGPQMQMPPAYSAIKVGGKKACDEARKGRGLSLEPRPITVKHLGLIAILRSDEGYPIWHCRARVSKGTYIRSLARDIGVAADACGHILDLRRVRSGIVSIEDCLGIPDIEEDPFARLCDPVALLGFPYAVMDALADKVGNGSPFPTSVLDPLLRPAPGCAFAATAGNDDYLGPGMGASSDALVKGKVSIVVSGELKAIYELDAQGASYKPSCVFQTGVRRG